jgi:alkylresorcinol/alkylpyrone synthase
LLGLACAVPPHVLDQDAVLRAARTVFGPRLRDFERLAPVFDNAGITTRYASKPLDWLLGAPGWAEKNAAYLESAQNLLEQAARSCLRGAGLIPTDVDALVVVSSTGIATPSLDSLLMERMGLRPDTRRLPVFGLGCAGGVLGLARAAELARAVPGSNVLLLVVELCSLTVRHGDLSPTNVVATALFGDGAAACLIRCDAAADPKALNPDDSIDRDPTGPGRGLAALVASCEHTWPGTRDIMGWRVANDGLGVVFSQDIPRLIRERLRPVLDGFLAARGMTRANLAGVACHPGGVKVLSALEEVLAPVSDGFEESRSVLRDYGNMSAVTVFFVLERRLAAGATGRHLLTAFGPGFTAALLLADL